MNKQMWNQAKHWRWSPHPHTGKWPPIHTDTHSHTAICGLDTGHWTVEKLLQLQLCARCVHFLLETNIGWRYWKMVNIFVPGRQLLLSLLASLRKRSWARYTRGGTGQQSKFIWGPSPECSVRKGRRPGQLPKLICQLSDEREQRGPRSCNLKWPKLAVQRELATSS